MRYICDNISIVAGKQHLCGQEFTTPRALGIHKAAHDRQKVKCPECGKTVMYLETHLRKAHAVNTEALMRDILSLVEEVTRLRAENEELRVIVARRN